MKPSEVLQRVKELIQEGSADSISQAFEKTVKEISDEAWVFAVAAIDRAFQTQDEAIEALDRAIALTKEEEE